MYKQLPHDTPTSHKSQKTPFLNLKAPHNFNFGMNYLPYVCGPEGRVSHSNFSRATFPFFLSLKTTPIIIIEKWLKKLFQFT